MAGEPDKVKAPEYAHTCVVYSSPEFIAFCKRFGIAHDLQTRSMAIRLQHDDYMTVTQEYFATDDGG